MSLHEALCAAKKRHEASCALEAQARALLGAHRPLYATQQMTSTVRYLIGCSAHCRFPRPYYLTPEGRDRAFVAHLVP